MKAAGVDQAIQKGMAFIAASQQPDGGFESFSSPTRSLFRPTVSYQTVFAPALILSSIALIKNGGAIEVRSKLAAWLLKQRSPNWSFNYWAKSAPQRSIMPYPDDLDDTFCALIALNRHDPSITDEGCLGRVVKLLIATEQQVGGPYRTWLAGKHSPAAWRDVDLAVNSNIACFLNIVAEPLPNLTALMEQAILARTFRSPYYPSPYPLVYYLARAYSGPYAPRLAQYLIQHRQHGWWGNPLHSALAIASLARLGQEDKCEAAIASLLKSQKPDGSWGAETFWLDPAGRKRKYYIGSDTLTTALVLEAFALYGQNKTISSAERQNRPNHTAAALHERILLVASDELSRLQSDLKRASLSVLDRTDKNDNGHEIVLLPYFFNRSLKNPVPAKSTDAFTNLGLANLYGWMAYTIYDDFLDGEGKPRLLSVANASLRSSLKHFYKVLPGDAAFQEAVNQTFDIIDGANAWELAHCRMEVTGRAITISRLPKYPATLGLADRSLGHTLTPLGILAAAGVGPNDPRATSVRLALRHYLVARQLNDDLHDWEQDLRAGIITYVVAEILRGQAVKPGKHTFAELIPKMQRQFWHYTLVEVCRTISIHTSLARRAAKSSGLLAQPNIVTQLLDKIDAAVGKTLAEQTKAEKFLAAYRGK